jgi:hypothetical protein
MRLYRARLLVMLALVPLGVGAQESGEQAQADEIAELEPAVSAGVPIDTAEDKREAIEPAVPSAVLSQDVRRRTLTNGVIDEMDLGRTEITGNQELPKVLYIVPWKKSDPGDLLGRPVNSLLDEVLAPIDRSEFIRQVGYYTDLYGKQEE